MKVDDYLEGIYVPFLSIETVNELLVKRNLTFLAFASIENQKGFVKPTVSFSSSQGQEMLRIMLFRTLEEVVEASEAKANNHVLEELIDALNYLMSALMLDQEYFTIERMTELTYDILNNQRWITFVPEDIVVSDHSILYILHLIMGRMAETFRNRAWMNQTQQTFFHGYEEAGQVYQRILHTFLVHFDSWETFYKFFVAKDNVLQFRLNSKY